MSREHAPFESAGPAGPAAIAEEEDEKELNVADRAGAPQDSQLASPPVDPSSQDAVKDAQLSNDPVFFACQLLSVILYLADLVPVFKDALERVEDGEAGATSGQPDARPLGEGETGPVAVEEGRATPSLNAIGEEESKEDGGGAADFQDEQKSRVLTKSYSMPPFNPSDSTWALLSRSTTDMRDVKALQALRARSDMTRNRGNSVSRMDPHTTKKGLKLITMLKDSYDKVSIEKNFKSLSDNDLSRMWRPERTEDDSAGEFRITNALRNMLDVKWIAPAVSGGEGQRLLRGSNADRRSVTPLVAKFVTIDQPGIEAGRRKQTRSNASADSEVPELPDILIRSYKEAIQRMFLVLAHAEDSEIRRAAQGHGDCFSSCTDIGGFDDDSLQLPELNESERHFVSVVYQSILVLRATTPCPYPKCFLYAIDNLAAHLIFGDPTNKLKTARVSKGGSTGGSVSRQGGSNAAMSASNREIERLPPIDELRISDCFSWVARIKMRAFPCCKRRDRISSCCRPEKRESSGGKSKRQGASKPNIPFTAWWAKEQDTYWVKSAKDLLFNKSPVTKVSVFTGLLVAAIFVVSITAYFAWSESILRNGDRAVRSLHNENQAYGSAHVYGFARNFSLAIDSVAQVNASLLVEGASDDAQSRTAQHWADVLLGFDCDSITLSTLQGAFFGLFQVLPQGPESQSEPALLYPPSPELRWLRSNSTTVEECIVRPNRTLGSCTEVNLASAFTPLELYPVRVARSESSVIGRSWTRPYPLLGLRLPAEWEYMLNDQPPKPHLSIGLSLVSTLQNASNATVAFLTVDARLARLSAALQSVITLPETELAVTDARWNVWASRTFQVCTELPSAEITGWNLTSLGSSLTVCEGDLLRETRSELSKRFSEERVPGNVSLSGAFGEAAWTELFLPHQGFEANSKRISAMNRTLEPYLEVAIVSATFSSEYRGDLARIRLRIWLLFALSLLLALAVCRWLLARARQLEAKIQEAKNTREKADERADAGSSQDPMQLASSSLEMTPQNGPTQESDSQVGHALHASHSLQSGRSSYSELRKLTVSYRPEDDHKSHPLKVENMSESELDVFNKCHRRLAVAENGPSYLNEIVPLMYVDASNSKRIVLKTTEDIVLESMRDHDKRSGVRLKNWPVDGREKAIAIATLALCMLLWFIMNLTVNFVGRVSRDDSVSRQLEGAELRVFEGVTRIVDDAQGAMDSLLSLERRGKLAVNESTAYDRALCDAARAFRSNGRLSYQNSRAYAASGQPPWAVGNNVFDSLNFLYFGTVQEELHGCYIALDKSVLAVVKDSSSRMCLQSFPTKSVPLSPDVARDISFPALVRENASGPVFDDPACDRGFKPTLRPWYDTAIRKEKRAWTDAYEFVSVLDGSQRSKLGISLVEPLRRNSSGNISAVAAVDILLDSVWDYLGNTSVVEKQNRTIFLMDKSGRLLASSSDKDSRNMLVSASTSLDVTVRSTAEFLLSYDSVQKLDYFFNSPGGSDSISIERSEDQPLTHLFVLRDPRPELLIVITVNQFDGDYNRNLTRAFLISASATIICAFAVLSNIVNFGRTKADKRRKQMEEALEQHLDPQSSPYFLDAVRLQVYYENLAALAVKAAYAMWSYARIHHHSDGRRTVEKTELTGELYSFYSKLAVRFIRDAETGRDVKVIFGLIRDSYKDYKDKDLPSANPTGDASSGGAASCAAFICGWFRCCRERLEHDKTDMAAGGASREKTPKQETHIGSYTGLKALPRTLLAMRLWKVMLYRWMTHIYYRLALNALLCVLFLLFFMWPSTAGALSRNGIEAQIVDTEAVVFAILFLDAAFWRFLHYRASKRFASDDDTSSQKPLNDKKRAEKSGATNGKWTQPSSVDRGNPTKKKRAGSDNDSEDVPDEPLEMDEYLKGLYDKALRKSRANEPLEVRQAKRQETGQLEEISIDQALRRYRQREWQLVQESTEISTRFHYLYIATLAVLLVDFIVAVTARVSLQYYVPLRPLLLIFANRSVYRTARIFFVTLISASTALMLFLTVVVVGGVLGLLLFQDVLSDELKSSFLNYVRALTASFIFMSTGENYTEIVYPAVRANVWFIAFFAFFSILAMYFVLAMVINMFQTAFKKEREALQRERRMATDVGLVSAFALLDVTGDQRLDRNEFSSFIKQLRPLQLQSVGTEALEELSRKLFELVDHILEENRSVERITMLEFVRGLRAIGDGSMFAIRTRSTKSPIKKIACLFFFERPYFRKLRIFTVLAHLSVAILFGVVTDSTRLGSLLICFVLIFLAEVILRLWAYGRKEFFFYNLYHSTIWAEDEALANRADFLIFSLTLMGLIVSWAHFGRFLYEPSSSWSRVVMGLPLLRIFIVVRHFRELLFSLVRQLRQFAAIFVLMLTSFFVFGVYGVLMLSGRFDEVLRDEDDIQDFDSIGQAFLALYQIMLGESWNDLTYAAVNVRRNFDVSFYFVAFVMLVTILFTQLITGLALEAFQSDYEMRQMRKSSQRQEATKESEVDKAELDERSIQVKKRLRAVTHDIVRTGSLRHTVNNV